MPLVAIAIVRVVGCLLTGLALGWLLRHAQSQPEPVEAHGPRRGKPECSEPPRSSAGGVNRGAVRRTCRSSRNGKRDDEGGLEGRCVVCFTEPATMGFAHGGVVHCCLCRGCWKELQRRGQGNRCILCNSSAVACLQVVGT